MAASAILTSDDFSAGLDGSTWTVVDPLGDGTVTTSGQGTADATLDLTVPAGTSHDPWDVNRALRVVQPIADGDFEVEVKFDSVPTQKYQMQGLMVEQDDNDWLRFDVFSTGSQLYAFAASTTNGNSSAELSKKITASGSVWLRVARTGDTWDFSWSDDGTTFSLVGSFGHALAVDRTGPYAANHSPSPAYTAVVDYVFDTANPISPEDPEDPAEPDTTAPTISDVQVAATDTTATVTWTTDEPATSTVAYGPTTAYENGTTGTSDTTTDHHVVLEGLDPASTYHFQVQSQDTAGNTATTDDNTFTTEPSSGSSTSIDVWYGDDQTFGHLGLPQPWVNIVGNVSGPHVITSLRYSLNGGQKFDLGIGPDQRRLEDPGDFNIEIAFDDLTSGANTVEIEASDETGATSTQTVTVRKQAPSMPGLPHTTDWASGDLASETQVVDGKWAIRGGNLRTQQFGFDRMVALGDLGWTDYEVVVPVTVHEIGPRAGAQYSGPALVGLGLRWDGHYQLGREQPNEGYWNGSTYAWHRFADTERWQVVGNDNSPSDNESGVMTLGETYMLKARIDSSGPGTGHVQFKYWPADSPEPGDWILSIDDDDGNSSGSLVLIAHHVDATFGTVTVTETS